MLLASKFPHELGIVLVKALNPKGSLVLDALVVQNQMVGAFKIQARILV